MSYLPVLRNLIRSKKAPIFWNHPFVNIVRPISTSPKGSDISTVSVESEAKNVVKKRIRPWRSYGFDLVDEVQDIFLMHVTSFLMITLFGCTTIFLFMYYPDLYDQDWYAREAYLQVRRREVLGLPMIDKNYVDPATVRLPPEEELDNDDIII